MSDAGDTAPEAGPQTEVTVQRRRRQYLIAETSGPLPQGVEPLDLGVIEQACKEDPAIEYVKTLTPRHVLGALAARGMTRPQSIIVAEMPRNRAEVLKQHPQLIVEDDEPLTYAIAPPPRAMPNPGVIVSSAAPPTVTITVVGRGGAPLAGATVYLFAVWPSQGVTDASGRVHLTLLDQSVATVKGIYVNPKAEYWSLWVDRPLLDVNLNNVVALTPLTDTLAGFPGQELLGWGQRAMKLDQIPAHYRGQGVKVAVIDSGAAVTHPDLQGRVAGGVDVIAQNEVTWSQDDIAHGSHCAGVIAGSENGTGIRGFAPQAELHVCKIFPDGRFSHLIEALDYCIERRVDVANLSLGTDERSELVDQKIEQARQAGVACIVAAGNTEGPVRYPASSPNCLAVAAIGKEGEYPADSYHATQVATTEGTVTTDEGYFSAKFTCFGPEIAVCAPGVAIVSSVPDTGYAAWDGTSMAAPHVAGLAALVLAHHDDFKGPYRTRNARRVDRLFEILRGSCRPLDVGDRQRTGAGLPDAVLAFTSAPPQSADSDSGGQADGGPSLLQEVAALMQESGLLPPGAVPSGTAGVPSNGSPESRPAGGAATSPPLNLEQLGELMAQAGLS